MFDARTKLNEICGFPKPQSTGADLVKHLIENTEKRIQETAFKEATAKALLLLSKWQEWRWSHNHIISRLLEVMKKVCNFFDHGGKRELNLRLFLVSFGPWQNVPKPF